MQVDTLHMTRDEFQGVYFDGASVLPDDVQSAIRVFLITVQETEDRYNRVAGEQMGLKENERPPLAYRARIHVHFVVEPA